VQFVDLLIYVAILCQIYLCGSHPEDLKGIALSKEQGNLGMVTSNDDVFKEIQYFRSSKQQPLF